MFRMTVKNVRADAGALVTTFRDVSTGDVAWAGSLSAFEWLDFWLFMWVGNLLCGCVTGGPGLLLLRWGWGMVPHGADWWRLLSLADVGDFLLLSVGLVLTVEAVKRWLFWCLVSFGLGGLRFCPLAVSRGLISGACLSVRGAPVGGLF